MFLFTRGEKTSGLTALDIQRDGIAVAQIMSLGQGRKAQLTACEYHDLSAETPCADVLKSVAEQLRLRRAPCTTLLHPDAYHLILTEAPQVPQEELCSALRWQIKDLVNMPVDQVTLDVIKLPGIQNPGGKQPVYVVAADNRKIQQHLEPMHAAHINLQAIDIHEMAQRNIAALLPEEEAGVALISLTDNSGMISLTRAGLLYLSRTLGFGLDQLRDLGNQAYEQVLLELQRSLDYFESHLHQPPIHCVALAPLPEAAQDLPAYLGDNMTIPVTSIDLEKIIERFCVPPPNWQSRLFFAIGAALRQELAVR